jgi:hypothetical protein
VCNTGLPRDLAQRESFEPALREDRLGRLDQAIGGPEDLRRYAAANRELGSHDDSVY